MSAGTSSRPTCQSLGSQTAPGGASVYVNLVSLLSSVPGEELAGKRLLLYSYGSGCAATLYTMHVRQPLSRGALQLACIVELWSLSGSTVFPPWGQKQAWHANHTHRGRVLNFLPSQRPDATIGQQKEQFV